MKLLATFAVLVALIAAATAHAVRPGPRRAIRPGFVEAVVVDSLDSPVSMAIAPDGRILVCEQGGPLRVIRHGRLLPAPFWIAPTRAFMEEGLLGVAFGP